MYLVYIDPTNQQSSVLKAYIRHTAIWSAVGKYIEEVGKQLRAIFGGQ